ncbi:MAG: 4Fe-4S dicluster domain-containing protein [Deltaproteobacteria bacterium]|nr:4Fe-4S dicluster domain-containing protein [Deltaproteobacteria bacterium]
MISFIPNRCQPWLYKKAECRLCADVCPIEGCIRFEGNTICIKTEDCIGCGICTNVCPSSALVMDSLSDKEILNRLQANVDGDSLIFGCSLGPNNVDTNLKSQIVNRKSQININLPCLAMLKESHLVSLTLSGVDNIHIDISHCDSCSFKYGKPTIAKTVSYADTLLNAMGYYDCIRTDTRHQTPDTGQDKKSTPTFCKNKKQNIKTITPGAEYSRRELLNFFREKAVEKVVGKTNVKKVDGKGVDGVPDRRKLLLDVLQAKGNLQLDKLEEGRFPVHQIRIDSDCTLCNDCNLFCPAGALTKVEQKTESDDEAGEVRIDFNMSLCIGCYQCADLCREDAMHIEKFINLAAFADAEIKTLFKKTNQKCPSCNRYFYPEDGAEECLICAKRNSIDQKIFGGLFNNDTETEENKSIQ